MFLVIFINAMKTRKNMRNIGERYTAEELQEIRDMVTHQRVLHPTERRRLQEILLSTSKEEVDELNECLGLLVTNKLLYTKLLHDPIRHDYGILPFLPETYPLFYECDTVPKVFVVSSGGNDEGIIPIEKRELVFCIQHPKKALIVKDQKFPVEQKFARQAAELGIGPTQYKTFKGFLTEEVIHGEGFLSFAQKWPRKESITEFMYEIGKTIGECLDAFHRAGMLYNNSILLDICDMETLQDGHFCFYNGKPTKLYDFGQAFFIKDQKNYTNEDVLKFAVMTSEYKIRRLADKVSVETHEDVLNLFRKQLTSLAEDEVRFIDVQHLLSSIDLYCPPTLENITEPFLEGFQKTYTFVIP